MTCRRAVPAGIKTADRPTWFPPARRYQRLDPVPPVHPRLQRRSRLPKVVHLLPRELPLPALVLLRRPLPLPGLVLPLRWRLPLPRLVHRLPRRWALPAPVLRRPLARLILPAVRQLSLPSQPRARHSALLSRLLKLVLLKRRCQEWR